MDGSYDSVTLSASRCSSPPPLGGQASSYSYTPSFGNNNNNNSSSSSHTTAHHQHHQLLMPTMTLTTTTINQLTLSPPPTNCVVPAKPSSLVGLSLPPARSRSPAPVPGPPAHLDSFNSSSDFQSDAAFDPLLLMNEGIFPLGVDNITPPPPAPSSVLSNSSLGLGLEDDINNYNNDEDTKPQATEDDDWLDDIKISVSSLSLEPLSGTDVVERVRECANDVLTRYIPCADFLVQCQQELRKGLTVATQKRTGIYGKQYYSQNLMTPLQYYSSFVEPMPQRFLLKNEYRMDQKALEESMIGLQKLLHDARKSHRLGCESVKNSFLGGMKDGESWGLRKWLSRSGNASHICTNMECLLNACKQLDKNSETTKKLADKLRPLAKDALHHLKKDIPSSYQEVSAAHPYLPFFHRLESSLRSMSKFDPDEDDVICLDDDSDDDDDDEAVVEVVKPPQRKRRKLNDNNVDMTIVGKVAPPALVPKPAPAAAVPTRLANNNDDDGSSSSSGESDDEAGIVEVVDTLNNFTPPGVGFDRSSLEVKTKKSNKHAAVAWPLPTNEGAAWLTAEAMAYNLNQVAHLFDQNKEDLVLPAGIGLEESFWDGERYASALRVFINLLKASETAYFLERVDEDLLIQVGAKPYSHVVKNPLCFRDIVSALVANEDEETPLPFANNGMLPAQGLSKWNMWRGMDLLQAIDLVLLNSLAYGKTVAEGRSKHRSITNKLRKMLWTGIEGIVTPYVGSDPERRRQCTPVRRSENSGFVVYKIKER